MIGGTEFIQDLVDRLKDRVQLTTDELKMYLTADADGFGPDTRTSQYLEVS